MKPLSIFDPNSDRVTRGGCWSFPSRLASAAYRFRWTSSSRYTTRGFRLYLEV